MLVIFFPSCADDLLFLALSTYTLYQKKKPPDKSLGQTCEEANAILIDLFSLYAKLQQMHHVTACVKPFYCIYLDRSLHGIGDIEIPR